MKDPSNKLYGPFLKVERAEHHINKLETIFRRYVAENMKRLRPQKKQRALKQGKRIVGANFPKHTPTILGDVIHNLRASLDHAYCVLTRETGGNVDDFTRFPFGKDRQSLKGTINGHKKKGIAPSTAVCDFIVDELQPYMGGKLRFYEIHRLDITDKHIVLLPTTTNFHIDELHFTDETGNPTGGGIQGITLAINQSANPDAAFINPGPGGLVMKGNPKSAFEITFAKGEPCEGESILKTIREMRDSVQTALVDLQNFLN